MERGKNLVLFHQRIKEYTIIILFSVLGGTILMASGDLISLYLSIELQSFSLYILSTIATNSENSTSCGLKYFLIGSLASGFILLGISLIYLWGGCLNLESLYTLTKNQERSSLNFNQAWSAVDMTILKAGVSIIIIGLLIKIGAAPFHHTVIDVYSGVPLIVTLWLV
ncbi:NADH dehydrogenase subunit 2, partial (mitochondrion) [Neolecta irregularis DAH-3]